MKPKRIILIRHGESKANVNRYLFGCIPDYRIELTRNGLDHARNAGMRLKEMIGNESLYFYVSPFWRTRSTFEQLASVFPRQQYRYNEEPRLREQEWGYLRCNDDFDRICRERKEYGIFITGFREARQLQMYMTASMICWVLYTGIFPVQIFLITVSLSLMDWRYGYLL